MPPPPLTPQPEMHHLPRLDPKYYRGFAAVLWTITLKRRATGWLDPLFHASSREWLLHAAAREQLFCPTYVLMPDHIHVFWLGVELASDQRNAMRFLRKHLQAELARRSGHGFEFELQKQSHDRVLREKDRYSWRPVQRLLLRPGQSPPQRLGRPSARLALPGGDCARLPFYAPVSRGFLAAVLEALYGPA